MLRLTLAAGHYDRTEALRDGRVRAEGIDLTYIMLRVEEIFWRMAQHREFDASEFSLGGYVVRRGRGEPETHTVPGTGEYRLMVEHFAACVLEDAPPRYDAWDAARTLRVLEALARSARDRGRPVAVEPL